MFQLVYISIASADFHVSMMPEILAASRRNNARRDITGALVFANGSFLQVLEGEEEAVESLYKMIERDRRHSWTTRLYSNKISQRCFPDWAMGWHQTDGSCEIAHLISDISDKRDLEAMPTRRTRELDRVFDIFANRKFGDGASQAAI